MIASSQVIAKMIEMAQEMQAAMKRHEEAIGLVLQQAEVLAGVHEHLDASLPPGASDGDVRRTLAELGSPHSVADEAYAGAPAPAAAPTTTMQAARPGALSRSWLPVVVGLTLGFALWSLISIAFGGSSYSITSSITMDALGNTISSPDVIDYPGEFPIRALNALLSTALLWLPPVVLCLVSPLWSATEKATAALILPLTALALTALPDLGWAVTHSERGIGGGAWSGLALGVIGGGYLILRTSRSGLQRAVTLDRPTTS